MDLSISNIAWSNKYDDTMYEILKNKGFKGIEVAPTRLFPQSPYENIERAGLLAVELKKLYALSISSMQSIWYGRNENIFNSAEERAEMLEYTKKVIDFASAIGCKNIVFGCPKNRIMKNDNDMEIAVSFFKELGGYAVAKDTVLSIEPNPVIYNTNFINTTIQAFEFANSIKCKGFRVNVDFGAILYYKEKLRMLDDNMDLINHIHISEPGLEPIKRRNIHGELAALLREKKYDKFVSIEMKDIGSIPAVQDIIDYVKEVFG
jgi:sugar phosphate isomerase/epimerase